MTTERAVPGTEVVWMKTLGGGNSRRENEKEAMRAILLAGGKRSRVRIRVIDERCAWREVWVERSNVYYNGRSLARGPQAMNVIENHCELCDEYESECVCGEEGR